MGYVPFVGRLNMWEYLALFISFSIIGLESFIRIITLALPRPVIRFFYNASRKLFNLFSTPQSRRSRNKKKAIVTSIAQASDFVEICDLFGYYAEEHVIQTGDGYLLGLHRLGFRKNEVDPPTHNGYKGSQKKVIYMHHGLLMNSEVWVCLTEKERCLPFMLVDRGYDVWLGNNRGNKYSKKSIHCAPTENRFWNFSIDQFAFHDVPDSINYILSATGQKSLSYIGFSQGTAQAFASLSINPGLNEKVNMFIALAPAMSPSGLSYGIVDTFIKTSPEVLFLAFGRRSLLSAATMWQAILYPPIFIRFIDLSISFLFGWRTRNIPMHQKLAAYPHLYSFTSTKSVVHWFQIMRNGVFQMYDDEVQGPLNPIKGAKYYKVPKFPTRNIKTPIVLVYGGSDSLVDINVMLKELPRHTKAIGVPHYEHLDFLWAIDVDHYVFPHVLDVLASVTASPRLARGVSANYHGYNTIFASGKHTALESEPESRYFVEDEDIDADADVDADADIDSPIQVRSSQLSENYPPEGHVRQTHIPLSYNERASSANQSSRPKSPPTPPSILQAQLRTKPRFPSSAMYNSIQPQDQAQSPSVSASFATERSSNSRPEGWWSSDEVAGTEPSSAPSKSSSREKEKERQTLVVDGSEDLVTATNAVANTTTGVVPSQCAQSGSGSRGGGGSSGGVSGTNIGTGGISIGASRAVGGLSDRDAVGMSSAPARTNSLDSRGRRKGGKKRS